MRNSETSIIFLFLRFGLLIIAEQSRQKRIIGGKPASANSFPWQVNFITRKQSKSLQRCSGSLINTEWIITAAHCFDALDLTDLSIMAGDHYMNATDRFETELYPDQQFTHPSYLPAFGGSPGDFDVTLVHLKAKINLSSGVHPVRLPNATTRFLPGHLCTISGWGNTVNMSSYNRSNMLRQAEVKLVARDMCNSNISYGGKISERFLCAGYREGGRDSCFGDSGGPLQCKTAPQGEWILTGLVAWGDGCAKPNKYGVYLNVSEILPFVNSIIGDGKTSQASHVVNDSIWRSSNILGTSIGNMATQVNTTQEKLLNTPLKDLLPLLLTIEKRLVIKRIVSDLAISPAVLNRCFLTKKVRMFLAAISMDNIKGGENLLWRHLGNKHCFFTSATIGVLVKLTNTTLDSILSLNLISFSMKLFKVEREKLYTDLRLSAQEGASLEKYNVSEISRLLLENSEPSLKNSTIREVAMIVLRITGQSGCTKVPNLCSRNAQCIDLVGSHTCRCKKGFVGNGGKCRTGPVIFNVTYKQSGHEFTKDLDDSTSFNYRYRSDGISLFFRYVYSSSFLWDVFLGVQVQDFRKGSVIIETLQVFDFDADGRLPSADDIRMLLHPRVDLVIIQARDFCQLGIHNCSGNSSICKPYPGGFYCQPSNGCINRKLTDTSNSAEKYAPDK